MTWYRADMMGLPVGESATFAPDGCVYVTSDLNAARAFAARRAEQSGLKFSVYRVSCGDTWPDPDYWKFPEIFVCCGGAIIEELIEKESTMTAAEGTKYMCDNYSPWPQDGSPMYGEDGYPTASPDMRKAGIDAAELRHLGTYADAEVIGHHAEGLVAGHGGETQ